ncbi:MAG: hypothetical protein J5613_00935 [Alphaproteobacteria bacterium]|nr:hypothetical protein [Alphaproteobacteria bacterium]MBR4806303.1 hypothetical protein [Alphaproteobacteria bacterium]
MSQNIKYTKYKVELERDGRKQVIEFGDLEVLSLVACVKEQVCVFDKPIKVIRETTTYNLHNTKPVNILKSQNPTKKDEWTVWNGLYRTVPFAQFCGFLGYEYI